MTFTKRNLIFVASLFCLAFTPVDTAVKQKSEIVFCLDLSASTNGLLPDIRDNIWNVVNNARQNMPETDLRMGVIVFARPGFGKKDDYIKVLCDLTENYDSISYNLYKLSAVTEKGEQCDGSALFTAIVGMNWSQLTSTKKMIYLFGNGKVNQCGYNYRKAYEMAAKQNISIHTVYCVNTKVIKGEIHGWEEIASATGGNSYTFQIAKRSSLKKFSGDTQWLVDVNNKLNDTYIYFGDKGKQRYELMLAADNDSKKMNEQFFYSRCRYKLSEHYLEQCSGWDLVSALQTDSTHFDNLNFYNLPKEYENWNPQLLKKAVRSQLETRERLMKQIQDNFAKITVDTTFQNPYEQYFP